MEYKNELGIIIILAIFVIIGAMAFSGCMVKKQPNQRNTEQTQTSVGFNENLKEVSFDGHQYIVYTSGTGGGITHKANCDAVHSGF